MNNWSSLILAFIFSTLLIISISWPDKEIISYTDNGDLTYEESPFTLADLNTKRFLSPVIMVAQLEPSGGGFFDVDITATAFFIKHDRKSNISYALTNEHVCAEIKNDEGSFLIGMSSNNEKAQIIPMDSDYIFEVVGMDSRRDLCLIKTDGYAKPVRFIKESNKLTQFERLYVVGAPSGNFPMVIETHFSGYLPRNQVFRDMVSGSNNDYLLISEIFHGGVSGSPVFNKRGEAVGIMFASLRRSAPPFVNNMSAYGGIAVGIEDIRDFLNEYDVSI
jgi:S1-C subfamily serine protease